MNRRQFLGAAAALSTLPVQDIGADIDAPDTLACDACGAEKPAEFVDHTTVPEIAPLEVDICRSCQFTQQHTPAPGTCAECGDAVDAGGQTGDLWDRVGRKAAAMELEGARRDAVVALDDISTETMFRGEDPDPEQIREARRRLNDLRRILEEFVAPAAGCEEWASRCPHMPYGHYREIDGCPDHNAWGGGR